MHEEVESLIIAYPCTSAVSGVFYCYILQNKQSRRHSLCSEMTHVVLYASRTMSNIWTRNKVAKILPKKSQCVIKENTRQNVQSLAFAVLKYLNLKFAPSVF